MQHNHVVARQALLKRANFPNVRDPPLAFPSSAAAATSVEDLSQAAGLSKAAIMTCSVLHIESLCRVDFERKSALTFNHVLERAFPFSLSLPLSLSLLLAETMPQSNVFAFSLFRTQN